MGGVLDGVLVAGTNGSFVPEDGDQRAVRAGSVSTAGALPVLYSLNVR